MAYYSIKDLEQYTGIKAHTIRVWEKRYKIVKPRRTTTNIRYYCDEDLKKLLNVSLLNKKGHKISNIVKLSCTEINEKIMNLAYHSNDTESQVEGLVLAMIDMDDKKADKILGAAIINYGFEDAIYKIIYPFFERIGLLLQTNVISPAQEHFISCLARQKLIVAIDSLIDQSRDDAQTYLLFLPENEYHELGLLFYQYLIKKNGHHVVYLGQNSPTEAVLAVGDTKKVNCLLTSFIVNIDADEMQTYLNKLSESLPEKKIFVTGVQVSNLNIPLPSNVVYLKDIFDFKKFL